MLWSDKPVVFSEAQAENLRQSDDIWSREAGYKRNEDGSVMIVEGLRTHLDGVSYDQQLCWDLFTNTIEAGEVLGVDAAFRKQVREKRAKLLGPKIGRWGQLQEWMEDADDPDCNFGYAAAVNEMLAQSHMGVIHLLPALPKAWPDGCVRGMRLRGGYELDMVWKGGTLAEAVLRAVADAPEPCVIRHGAATKTCTLKKGRSIALHPRDFEAK